MELTLEQFQDIRSREGVNAYTAWCDGVDMTVVYDQTGQALAILETDEFGYAECYTPEKETCSNNLSTVMN